MGRSARAAGKIRPAMDADIYGLQSFNVHPPYGMVDMHAYIWAPATVIKRKLASKLPSYGRLSWHHVNHIIMSTTHHQVVWKCNSSDPCEFPGENILRRETLCFVG